jgi:hypothetical protein
VSTASLPVTFDEEARRRVSFGSNPRLNWLIAILLALLHGALALTASQTKSPTFDEPTHLSAGYSYWLKNDYRLDSENGILQQRWAALPLLVSRPHFVSPRDPFWRDSVQGAVAREFFYGVGNDPDRVVLQGRIMIAMTAVALCLLIYYCSAELFGPIGGLLSEVFSVFDPTLLAHGALVTSDTMAAFFFLLTVWRSWRLFQCLTWRRLIFAAFALSGLILAKFSGVLVAPMIVLICSIRIFSRDPQKIQLSGLNILLQNRWAKVCLMIGVCAVLSVAVFVSIWSAYGFRFSAFSADKPTRDIWAYSWNSCAEEGGGFNKVLAYSRDHHLLPEAFLGGLAYVHVHSSRRPAFLDGRWSLIGFRSFFPRAFAYKSTLPSLGLIAAGLAAAAIRWKKRHWLTKSLAATSGLVRRDLARLSPFWILLVLYGAAAMTTSLNIGHRHILPIYPPLFVLCGASALYFRSLKFRAGAIVISILTCWQVAESFAVRPDYLSYFNQAAGGPEEGYRHLVDSSLDWGQDLPGLKKWLTANAPARTRVYFSYFGATDPRWYGIDAIPLPYGRGRRDDAIDLEGGLYCISVTNLQQVYSRAMGTWALPYERYYIHLFTKRSGFASTGTASQRADFHAPLAPPEIEALDTLQFARLCAYLRRIEPVARIGNTIFVFPLTDQEVQRALRGPPVELADGIDVIDSD